MSAIKLILLALVQAATEFLPVSSSGHLLFLKGVLGLEELPLIFDIVLHVGSLAAIVIFYYKRLRTTVLAASNELRENYIEKPAVRFIVYAILATGITFIVYLFFEAPIEAMTHTPSVLKWTYAITTIILMSTFFVKTDRAEPINKKSPLPAVIVGLFQGLAIVPGISRSGSTVSASMLMKIKKDDAAYFSFVLAIPAILGALLFKLLDIEQMEFLLQNKLAISLSFVVSLVFSYLFLWILVWIIQKGKFWIFAVYTGAMSIVSAILF